MKEIPEDIHAAARELALCVQQEWNEFHAPSSKEIRLVAAAMLAERERCAKIAEDSIDADGHSGKFVADAIRGDLE